MKKIKIPEYNIEEIERWAITTSRFEELALISKAIIFAANAHKNQRRKDVDKTPYINHPLDLMNILIESGIVNCVAICGAILHDTIEDTETTYEQLVAEFGKRIADVVQEVSDDKNLPKQMRKELQITDAKKSSKNAKLIKLADKIANVKDLRSYAPEGWDQTRVDEYFIWAKKVVDQLRGTNKVLESKFDSYYI